MYRRRRGGLRILNAGSMALQFFGFMQSFLWYRPIRDTFCHRWRRSAEQTKETVTEMSEKLFSTSEWGVLYLRMPMGPFYL